jgi:hypothetical protein
VSALQRRLAEPFCIELLFLGAREVGGRNRQQRTQQQSA